MPASSIELALRGDERRLVQLEFAGGQLPQPAVGDVAILTQQAHALLGIERDRGGAAGMMHDVKFGAMAVRQHDLIDGDVDHASAKLAGLFKASSRKRSGAARVRTSENCGARSSALQAIAARRLLKYSRPRMAAAQHLEKLNARKERRLRTAKRSRKRA